MKKLSFLLLLLHLNVQSQEKRTHHQGNVEYYIDSVQVKMNYVHIEPNNIKSITIKKTGNRNGKIYIVLKKKKRLKSLSKIKLQRIHRIKKPTFIIDNTLIKRPKKVLIDEKAIGSIELIAIHKEANCILDLTIVKIMTKSALLRIEEREKGIIRIRGKEVLQAEL